MFQQQLRERAIRVRAGFVHRPEARLLLSVGIRAGFEHGLHDLEIAAGNRGVERLDLQGVLRGGIDVGARVDERLRSGRLAEERGQRDRRESVGAAAVLPRRVEVSAGVEAVLSESGRILRWPA